jgi:hypothetical protein
MNDATVASMYDGTAGSGGGKPTDLMRDDNTLQTKSWLRFKSGDSVAVSGVPTNYAWDGSNTDPFPAVVSTGSSGNVTWQLADASTAPETIHIAASNTYTYEDDYLPVLFNNGGTDGSSFGNGLTASFSKKVKTSDDTFDPAAGQDTSLLLSLDGFEGDADAWVNYPAASLLDGNWHNLQITWDGSGAGTKTYGHASEGNNNLKVYIDGAWVAANAYKGGTTTFTAADKHFKFTEGTFVPGTFGASNWTETGATTNYIYPFQGQLDNLSLHSEETTLAKAQEFYGTAKTTEGKPHNYATSATLDYSKVEGWWTFDTDSAITESSDVAEDSTSNNIDLEFKHFKTNVNNGKNYVTMTDSDSIYLASQVKGEGISISMTRNLKDDGTWVDSQDEAARLVLSFNGFERDAEHFVAYDVNQTGLSPAVNLLDGRWHSVTVSYQGTTDNDGTIYLGEDEIRYGKVTQGNVVQAYHIVVCYDGQHLEAITPASTVDDGSGGTLSGIGGFNVSKPAASGKLTAGFVIKDKHLKHVSTNETYVPTTYLASGIVETGTSDSIYAFQGGFDESSFHSNNWWDSGNTSTPTNYNQEKPLTLYGVTFGVAAEYQNRKKPYDLREPSSAGVTTTIQDQYINPNPYDASTNTGGGMEVYYRWGDTINDCSESVKDVRGHEGNPAVLDRDILANNMQHTDTESLATTDSGSGTLYSRDITADGITMYVTPASSTTEGGLQSNIVQTSGCAPSNIKQHMLKGPKLPHMRVKWSGAGSCDLGEDKCRAKLWFRRRKK